MDAKQTIAETLVDDEFIDQLRHPDAYRGDCDGVTYSEPLKQWIATLYKQDALNFSWYRSSTAHLESEDGYFALQEYDNLDATRQSDAAFEAAYGDWTPEQHDARDAEIEAEYAIHKLLPPGEKCYNDGPYHGSPEAEVRFRKTYLNTAKVLIGRLISGDDALSIHGALRDVREERSAAREEASLGKHYPRFLPGHEVVSAEFRAKHHAIHVIQEVIHKAWGDSDRQIGILVKWLDDMEAWSQGDMSNPEPYELPEVLLARDSLPETDDSEPLEPEPSVEPKRAPPPTPPPGFCAEFVNYANATARREQPILALLASMALVATLAGRKYRDSSDTRMNLYLVGLAKTGAGKDHARKITKRLLASCDRASVIVESFASAPAVVKAVNDRGGECLGLIDELGKYLAVATSKSAESFQSQILTVLMKLFTSSDSVYIGDSYVAADRKEIVIDQPNLCINATTTTTTFFAALGSKNLSDGFVNRLLAIEVEDDLPDNVQPKLKPLPASLVDACRYWSGIKTGEGDLAHLHPELITIQESPEVTARFEKFSKACDRIARTDRTPHTRDIYVRQCEMAKKLALIFAVSEMPSPDSETGLRREPRITLAACEWAIGFVSYCAEYIEKAVGEFVSDNGYQSKAKQILRTITGAGLNGIQHSKLLLSVKNEFGAKELKDIVASLHEAGQVFVGETKTGGPKMLTYFGHDAWVKKIGMN